MHVIDFITNLMTSATRIGEAALRSSAERPAGASGPVLLQSRPYTGQILYGHPFRSQSFGVFRIVWFS